VLFTRTGEIVQKLQVARQSLQLPSALAKLDRFDLIILDDLSYVRKDQAETSVLFELIAERYERKSLLITANQPFSGWNDVFPDPGMTVAAIDRLVHHSTIFELNVESYRRRPDVLLDAIQYMAAHAERIVRDVNPRRLRLIERIGRC
jgi:DNA replication protein DnaC